MSFPPPLRRIVFKSSSCAALLLPLGCAAEEGDLRFEVWGEEYIEDGIPSAEFEDGWSVTYERFLVVLGNVTVADGGETGGSLAGTRLYDLTRPGPQLVGELSGLEAGQWPNVAYEIPRAGDETQRHESARSGDLKLMRDGGYTLFAEGRARQGDREKTFAWGFDVPTRYEDCVDVRGGQETYGVVVSHGGSATHQLTIHGDHLFYDDLASGDAALRFEALAAADADDDGEITLDELSEVSLSELSSEDGRYGVGAFDVDTLGEFVAAATTSVGHFDGEGHCTATAR